MRTIRARPWRARRGERILQAIGFPIILTLNRPKLQRLGSLILDFALQCNGFQIRYRGPNGLDYGEEKFLSKNVHWFSKGLILDVGAHVGNFSKLVRKLAPEAEVYAFEPHPKTFRALERNTAELDVRAFNLALSDRSGPTVLYEFDEKETVSVGSTQASVDERAVSFYSSAVRSHRIEATTLDHFISSHGIRHVSLLKVDTEGHDLAVLRGGTESIRDGMIEAIQFEFIPANIGTRIFMVDFFDLLQDYRICRQCLNGDLWPLQPYDCKQVEIFAPQNIVALHKTHTGRR